MTGFCVKLNKFDVGVKTCEEGMEYFSSFMAAGVELKELKKNLSLGRDSIYSNISLCSEES